LLPGNPKKLRRGDFGLPGSKSYADGVQKLAKELADNVIYTDLVAKREGIDLAAAVELTWNSKSNEIGFTGRLQRGTYVPGAQAPQRAMIFYAMSARFDAGRVVFVASTFGRETVNYPNWSDMSDWLFLNNAKYVWNGPADLNPHDARFEHKEPQ